MFIEYLCWFRNVCWQSGVVNVIFSDLKLLWMRVRPAPPAPQNCRLPAPSLRPDSAGQQDSRDAPTHSIPSMLSTPRPDWAAQDRSAPYMKPLATPCLQLQLLMNMCSLVVWVRVYSAIRVECEECHNKFKSLAMSLSHAMYLNLICRRIRKHCCLIGMGRLILWDQYINVHKLFISIPLKKYWQHSIQNMVASLPNSFSTCIVPKQPVIQWCI